MTNSFLFNGDVVLHLLAVVAGIVERDCRNDVWFDEDGRRRDDA